MMPDSRRIVSRARPELFGKVGRAHINLNKIAWVLVATKAIDHESAITVSKIADLANLQRSNVSRLITGRPGFVQVTRHKHGNKSQGFYYLSDLFVPQAQLEDKGHYYPMNTAPLAFERMPLAEVVSDGLLTSATGMEKMPEEDIPTVVTESTRFRAEALKVEVLNYRGEEHVILGMRDDILTNLGINVNRALSGDGNMAALDNSLVALASLVRVIKDNATNPELQLMLKEN